jgi:large subunit ribosomal protein L13
MMGANAMKTFSPKPRDIERRWYVVDADGAVLGRLASEVAKILRGKHNPIFAPHMDTGDHVIVVNARGVRVTGGKEEKKIYVRHSGYPGGLNRIAFSRMISRRPVQVVEKAITGMLPKNRLGRQMARKLAVYEGSDHPHQAQKPVSLSLGEIPKWEGLPQPKPQTRPEPVPATKAPRRKEEPKPRRSRTGTEAKPAATSGGRRAAARVPAKSGAGSPARPSRKKATAKASTASGKASAKASRGSATKAQAGEEKAGSTRRSRGRKKTEKES